MIDTLTIAQELQTSGLSRKDAEAIAGAMGKFAASELATKENLKETEYRLRKDLEQFRAELQKDIANTKTELQKEIAETKSELKKDIHTLDLKIAETKAELQKDIRNITNNTVKWVAGIIIGQTAVIFTLIKLFG